jgi:hypothetical protein
MNIQSFGYLKNGYHLVNVHGYLFEGAVMTDLNNLIIIPPPSAEGIPLRCVGGRKVTLRRTHKKSIPADTLELWGESLVNEMSHDGYPHEGYEWS